MNPRAALSLEDTAVKAASPALEMIPLIAG
jgi:hypothetical protein